MIKLALFIFLWVFICSILGFFHLGNVFIILIFGAFYGLLVAKEIQ